jgi:hypothetical protein
MNMDSSKITEILLETQQKVAEDISQIKISLEKGVQLIEFQRRDHMQLEERVKELEKTQGSCPARLGSTIVRPTVISRFSDLSVVLGSLAAAAAAVTWLIKTFSH